MVTTPIKSRVKEKAMRHHDQQLKYLRNTTIKLVFKLHIIPATAEIHWTSSRTSGSGNRLHDHLNITIFGVHK